jgi:hypothetical protein
VLLSGVSLVVGLVLSNRLQRLVAEPIVRLADIARQVTGRNDYPQQAITNTGGEIGMLVDDCFCSLASHFGCCRPPGSSSRSSIRLMKRDLRVRDPPRRLWFDHRRDHRQESAAWPRVEPTTD